MFLRVVACCIGFTATFVLSAFSGPFDDHVGKYKGRGVERDSDGSTYYYTQSVKLEGASRLVTATIPGVVSLREFLRFRDNGTVTGSGRATGYNYSWTVRGRWRQEGDVIKVRTTTYYSDGGYSVESLVHRFKDGKLLINASGTSSDGLSMKSSYTGKLIESAP